MADDNQVDTGGAGTPEPTPPGHFLARAVTSSSMASVSPSLAPICFGRGAYHGERTRLASAVQGVYHEHRRRAHLDQGPEHVAGHAAEPTTGPALQQRRGNETGRDPANCARGQR
jgi:hypothetical protein